jgi:hypothetical protein
MAKASSHTPGPWIAKEWTSHSRTTITTGYGHEKVVADCAPGPVSGYLDTEAEANAQLIASAPDLLLALQSARMEFTGLAAYLETCSTEVIADNLPTVISNLNRKRELIETAILKAGGWV